MVNSVDDFFKEDEERKAREDAKSRSRTNLLSKEMDSNIYENVMNSHGFVLTTGAKSLLNTFDLLNAPKSWASSTEKEEYSQKRFELEQTIKLIGTYQKR